MRVAPQIHITEEQRKQLEGFTRGRKTEVRLVLRAEIVLQAASGKENQHIAKELRVSRHTVSLWRRRFAELGVAGIEKDAPRSGRLPTISAEVVQEIVRKTTQETPSNATHWSTRSMARVAGVSEATVRRIWHRYGLKPHRVRSFKLSNDPRFVEKLEEVIGLYLNPPEHALVFCVDEKSQIPDLLTYAPSEMSG